MRSSFTLVQNIKCLNKKIYGLVSQLFGYLFFKSRLGSES
ncbi:hypothetical protein HMPREF9184_00567 [Streptococcus sp. oral taxon 058 str. F0407]|nr:hypothetical protein HMPREF9184_00567 [Streptococcus sp. oral taxon 058 str. F0407]